MVTAVSVGGFLKDWLQNHILNEDIDFELDDLTFNSRTSGSSPEYFLGVEFR